MILICKNCKNDFKTYRSKKQFCNKKCYWKWKLGKPRKERSEEWSDRISNSLKGKPRKPFSNEHKENISKSHLGSKSSLWKGGVTPIHIRLRNSANHKNWAREVFERDNFTCQRCFQRGYKLHPHHIYNFAQWPDLRFILDNGITLCENCHKKFHKIYDKSNNNMQQIKRFISEDVIIKHMDTSLGQKEKFPEYFALRNQEKVIIL